MSHTRMLTLILGVILTGFILSSCGGPPIPRSGDEVPRITVDELKGHLDQGEAIVIGDVRDRGSYNAKHIAGAISLPASKIEDHAEGLTQEQAVVLY